jgi:hypothetical protein
LLRLKRCRTCDQWQSSRVSTPRTGSHCKLRPNTEGAARWMNSVTALMTSRNAEGAVGVRPGDHPRHCRYVLVCSNARVHGSIVCVDVEAQ